MTEQIALVVASAIALAAAVLFAAGVVVLAFGARIWGDATQSVHRARAHGVQADTEQSIGAAALSSLDDAAQRPKVQPIAASDRELLDAIISERSRDGRSRNGSRNGSNGHVEDDEFTTDANNGIEASPPIYPEGGMYR